MSVLELSPDQASAVEAIQGWYMTRNYDPLTLGGYAGTGKTTLLGQLPQYLPRGVQIHYASYTGKAVSVLRQKLPVGASLSTLHRLLYHPQPRKVCKVSGDDMSMPLALGWCAKHRPSDTANTEVEHCEVIKKLDFTQRQNPLDGFDLIVVDEASMVSEKIWQDLTKWGVPVLAVGDHGQLPPIKSDFNLMAKPQIKLETILRQAQGSPIIRMATMARLYGQINNKEYGPNCVAVPRRKMSDYQMDPDAGDLLIVGYNKTRNELNDAMRGLLDREGGPKPGDIVICLRNNYEAGVFNGMRGRIKEIEPNPYGDAFAVIEMLDEDFDYTGQIALQQFGEPKTQQQIGRWLGLFDYGYAMTCHKAQGSQADRVMVINERLPQTDHSRWLYTAVTRAANELIVVN